MALIPVAFFGLFIFSWVMYAGAKMAEIRGATFGQAFQATLAASVVMFVSVYAGNALGGAAAGLIFLTGSALVVHLIRVVFRTTIGRAFIVFSVNVLVQMITAGLLMRMLQTA